MAVKISTGLVRLSYANIFAPKSINGSDPKYSCSLLINKKDKATIDRIREAIATLKKDPDAIAKWKNSVKGLKEPLRDGDTEREDEAYEGHYFINANSNQKPQIVDKDRNPIYDEEEVYSGCYAQAVITFFPYNSNGNKGIGVGLNAIRKIKDGEHLGGNFVTDADYDDDILGDVEDDDMF